jgi:hypothetical protein
VKSVHRFDLIYLFAESRLGDVQSVGGPSEVQLFGQDDDCVEVTYFNLGEHCSKLHFPTGRDWLIALHLVKEPAAQKSIKKKLFSPNRPKGPLDKENA